MWKKVLKTSLIFLLIALIIIFTLSTVLAFVVPSFMAKKFESLNMKTLAYGCYDRQFRNSEKVDEQYVMFLKAEEISFNSHVVYYGEKLMQNENYNVLIVNINLSNNEKVKNYINENESLTENEKIRLQILCRNEDNFITNAYVEALVNLGKEEKAKNFLIWQINSILEDKRFDEGASFAVKSYISKYKTLPDDLKEKTISLFDLFSANLDVAMENLSISDRVCFQRLTEIATVLSVHFKNIGDTQNQQIWENQAQNYLNKIYA